MNKCFNAKPMPLSWLPNSEGYKFLGVLRNGTTMDCVVITRESNVGTMVHTVANYHDLVGWYRYK